MSQIAFVGLGRMGMPMCAALVRAGYQVIATDKRAEHKAEAAACAASWQPTPARAAARPVREQAVGQGVEVLEAPVGGGIAAAAEGRLQLFVGGEPGIAERHRALYGPADGELLAVALLEEEAGQTLGPGRNGRG